MLRVLVELWWWMALRYINISCPSDVTKIQLHRYRLKEYETQQNAVCKALHYLGWIAKKRGILGSQCFLTEQDIPDIVEGTQHLLTLAGYSNMLS